MTNIIINKRAADVAAFASDPQNAPKWYVNIKKAEWVTEPILRVGSRVAFVAAFLGRRLSYTYKIEEFLPGQKLVMSTAEGPFPMETTYTWEEQGPNSCKMTLRNTGQPSGFSKIMTPLMSMAMRRANNKDLRLLKSILEST